LSIPEEEKNKRGNKKHPTLALSLMEDKCGERVYTTLYKYDASHTEDFNFEEMSFAEVIGKRLRTKFEVLIDSVYIQKNGHISLSLKLDQALVDEDRSRGKSGRKMMCISAIPENVEVEIGEGDDVVSSSST
jgi:alpha-D-ribose 1-methylphosphonate 5-triphosphate diphosphatase PhnM